MPAGKRASATMPEWELSPVPPAPRPENIALLRERVEIIKASRAGFPPDGPIGWHAIRLNYYGALILALAQRGDWEPGLLSDAEQAVAEDKRILKHAGHQDGLRSIVKASELLNRCKEAIKWQKEYVECCSVLQPNQALGLGDLAELHLKCGDTQEAVSAFRKMLAADSASPGVYTYVASRLVDMSRLDEALNTLTAGVHKFESACVAARGKFERKRVFVSRNEWEGVGARTVYELCDPQFILEGDTKAIEKAESAGLIDVTSEAVRYEEEKARSALERMRRNERQFRSRLAQSRPFPG